MNIYELDALSILEPPEYSCLVIVAEDEEEARHFAISYETYDPFDLFCAHIINKWKTAEIKRVGTADECLDKGTIICESWVSDD